MSTVQVVLYTEGGRPSSCHRTECGPASFEKSKLFLSTRMWLQSIEIAEANVNRRRDAVAVESVEDFMITVGTRAGGGL